MQQLFVRNKQRFVAYNNFRKQIFEQFAAKDSEYILYLLPWLLSINHPVCPGYIANIKKLFRIAGIEQDSEIRNRENEFKQLFNIDERNSLLIPRLGYCLIQGVYTIGSVGTVGQTSSSDCDIWVCYDKNDFDPEMWEQLNQKVNLIKDWLDANIRIPVYFFISDVNDVRMGNFGSVDSESSGSTQTNLLKEEFYRTCIVICGKIPLWWVCYDNNSESRYEQAVSTLNQRKYPGKSQILDDVLGDDFVDLGDLEKVDEGEYFGASLWQLQKSLNRPLKSIIKMFLLKMQFDAPGERLISHRFREAVLSCDEDDKFPDPLIFTMSVILAHYNKRKADLMDFLKNCFYLRCDMKPDSGRSFLRNQMLNELFEYYPIDGSTRRKLDCFAEWGLDSQIQLGNQLFRQLIHIYNEITAAQTGVSSKINKRDLIILGRKIAACYQKKTNKIIVIPKPDGNLNLSTLTLVLDNNVWRVYAGNDRSKPLFSSVDIIHNIAFIVWNDLLVTSRIRMEPNPSSVTLQEIINLGKQIKKFLGTCNVFSIDYLHFLRKEQITKLMVVVSFEKNPWEKDINDLAIVYTNSWGEMFVERFKSPHLLDTFFRKSGYHTKNIETSYYLQRNCTFYEKIIERTQKILSILS